MLSPSTARLDREDELPIYANRGVVHVWLIDTEARTLEPYALHDGHWLLLKYCKDYDAIRIAPFDAMEFSLATLWP